MKLHFLGGTAGVTGSKFLLESEGQRILIDCGLFQGLKDLRLKNWAPFPVPPNTIDAIVLTHAHLDHSGYIPRLINNGFSGSIYSTKATKELCRILLRDSGYLQEEEAAYRNKKGSSKHHPALPLYTEEEAEKSLENFVVKPLEQIFNIGHVEVKFQDAGHILGAASVIIKCKGKTIVFSGDLGRFDDLLMTSPKVCPDADYVLMESTYGDRNHEEEDSIENMADSLKDIIASKGVLLIPSFAVGRAQTLLYILHCVFEKYPQLKVPVFLNSPMATDVTQLFKQNIDEHKLSAEECFKVCSVAKFVGSVEESKKLNESKGPMVIISASGMLTGGRILHHLKAFGGSPNNIIMLAGYQAAGTRGHALSSGNKELKIHGEYYNIKAKVIQTHTLSAHADQQDLINWLAPLKNSSVKKIFLIHGEPSASDALRVRIKDQMGLNCQLPQLGQTIELD